MKAEKDESFKPTFPWLFQDDKFFDLEFPETNKDSHLYILCFFSASLPSYVLSSDSLKHLESNFSINKKWKSFDYDLWLEIC